MTTDGLILINAGPYRFEAELLQSRAPETCAVFLDMLPFANQVIHSRWSGEAVWIPMGDHDTGLQPENHTSYPSRGDVLLYPGGFSETEFLFAYGSAFFASRMGQLAGNHFLSVVAGAEQLHEFGNRVLWEGAMDIEFTRK